MQEVTPQQEMDFQARMHQEQINSDPNSVYADSMRDEKIRNVISQINPEHLLTEIEHRLRGEKKNHYTEQWELIDASGKKINEALVQNYVSFLNVYITQNTSMSNFSPQEINNIMEVVINYIRDDLSDNAEKYGLTTKHKIEKKVLVKVLTPYKNPKDGVCSMKETIIESTQEISIGEELTDYDEFNRIGHMICQATFAVLKQAQNGGLAARIFKALRVTESLNDVGKKDKMNFLKFW